jgi:hypothetical protein
MGNSTGIDRRKFKRLDVALDVVVSIEADDKKTGLPEKMQATCSNLSLHGLCLETTDLANGAVKLLSGPAGARDYTLALEIGLTPQDAPLQVRGQVCWYNVDNTSLNFTYQVGVEFVGLAPESRATLKRFIQDSCCRRPSLFATIKSFFTFR